MPLPNPLTPTNPFVPSAIAGAGRLAVLRALNPVGAAVLKACCPKFTEYVWFILITAIRG